MQTLLPDASSHFDAKYLLWTHRTDLWPLKLQSLHSIVKSESFPLSNSSLLLFSGDTRKASEALRLFDKRLIDDSESECPSRVEISQASEQDEDSKSARHEDSRSTFDGSHEGSRLILNTTVNTSQPLQFRNRRHCERTEER